MTYSSASGGEGSGGADGGTSHHHHHHQRAVKHKRRYCKTPGCTRIVKSQGLCQRHGAVAKKCRVEGCPKQAQGNFNRMCSKFCLYVPPITKETSWYTIAEISRCRHFLNPLLHSFTSFSKHLSLICTFQQNSTTNRVALQRIPKQRGTRTSQRRRRPIIDHQPLRRRSKQQQQCQGRSCPRSGAKQS